MKNSSRVRFDLFQNSWLAEDGTRTGTPFAMNQIQEEVLMPVINNLMQETRIERLKIYNNIRDQKLSYLNKWHQDVEAAFRDNRAAGNDLITQITNAYAEYNTAYQTYISYKNTQDQMRHSGSLSSTEVQEVDASSETIRGWEEQAEKSSKASEVFQKYMEELQEDINKRSEQFNHVEYYEGSLRDLESRDTARSLDASLQQSLDDRHRRYTKHFNTLDKALEQRIHELDKAAMELGRLQHGMTGKLCGECSKAMVYSVDTNEIANKASQAQVKVRSSKAIGVMPDDISAKLHYNSKVNHILKEDTVESKEEKYIPVVVVESESMFDKSNTVLLPRLCAYLKVLSGNLQMQAEARNELYKNVSEGHSLFR